ncbi:hypothetical protein DL769_010479 [Monosporascus sp. CRB-8-3]|nr:hypothetical protein DL769_010479 [Monosporascus sp. CRB-8-3]
MRSFSLFSITGIAAIFDLVRAADFYIYAVDEFEHLADNPAGVRLSGFAFYDSPPDCDNAGNSIFLPNLDHASSNHGVRCEGCGTGPGGHVDVTVLEWNTDAVTVRLIARNECIECEWALQSVYLATVFVYRVLTPNPAYCKDRDGSYIDLGGVVHGRCVVDTSVSYTCVFPPGTYTVKGISQLHCTPGPPASEPIKPVLRIQPLGGSITKGSGSSDGNGYRRPLREMLADIAADIDMIGSLADGTMEDSSHKGHSGSFLAEIHGYALSSLGASPKVVLLHAGTNNMDLGVGVDAAPGLVQGIIDEILDRLPDTTVIVARIIWANDPRMQANTNAFNARIEGLVTENERAGKHRNGRQDKVILADLNGDGLTDCILADDDGSVRAWINNGIPLPFTEFGKINPPWQSVTGSMVRMADVENDGRADMIVLYSDGAAKATGLDVQEKIRIEDMDRDGYADYVILYSGGAVKWARNTHNNGEDLSQGNWEEPVTICPGTFRGSSRHNLPIKSIRFADLDGDRRVDIIFVDQVGAARARLNQGDGMWNYAGEIVPGPSEDVSNSRIEFADVNGDGLADYLLIYGGGAVKAFLNNGNIPDRGRGRNWQEGLTISPGIEGVPGDKVHSVDITGDGRADFLVIWEGGALRRHHR